MMKLINVTHLPDCFGEFLCKGKCFDCQVYDLCKTRYMEYIIQLRKDAGFDTRIEEEKLRKKKEHDGHY
jgi:hypothetical protein